MLDRTAGCPYELLWLLPPDGAVTDGLMIADVAATAVRLAMIAAAGGDGAEHYVAYMDLVIRSLLRLKGRFPEAAQAVLEKTRVKKFQARLLRLSRLLPDGGVACCQRLTDLLR